MRKVVIVGGGTAGWMTAAYLAKVFQDRVAITVIESGDVGTIGVGEATFSDIRHYFEFLGLEEQDWMPACNATYKLAVRFQDWRHPGHHFYHPFELQRSVDGFPLMDWWLKQRPSDRFDRDCFVMAAICDAERSPRHIGGQMLDNPSAPMGVGADRLTMSEHQGKTQFPYAYHFEAAMLADYLCEYGTERGVRHIIDHVEEVRVDEQNWVTGLETRSNATITGDLYIDCTGFKGLLINKALGEPFVSYKDYLPNDSAVALQVPLDMATRGVSPYTRATARDAGWIWTIPLYGRIGTGYVYARDYLSPEEAETDLRSFVGPEAAEVPAHHIRMRVGRTQRSWVHNCVAIGLSSGFVEPLESTGIFFIHHAIEQLVRHFPDDDWNPAHRDGFNEEVADTQDGVLEFLSVHYLAAARNDNQYWRDAKKRTPPPALGKRLERWTVELPNSETTYPRYHGLPPYSYMCILLGMGGIEMQHSPALDYLAPQPARDQFAQIQQHGEQLVETLPTPYEYFTSLRR